MPTVINDLVRFSSHLHVCVCIVQNHYGKPLQLLWGEITPRILDREVSSLKKEPIMLSSFLLITSLFLKKKKIHFLPPSVSRYDLGYLNYIPHHKNFLAFEKIQDGLSAHCSIRKEQQGLRYNIQEKILWYYQWENQPVFSLACVSY